MEILRCVPSASVADVEISRVREITCKESVHAADNRFYFAATVQLLPSQYASI